MKAELAHSYALALFSLTKENGSIRNTRDEFFATISFLFSKENELFLKTLSSYSISEEDRLHLLQTTLLKEIKEKHFASFLKMIVAKHYVDSLPMIEKEFRHLANEDLKIKEGIIYSVYPLNEKEISSFEEIFAKKLNVEVDLVNRVDKRLIGGVRIYIDNELFDGSLEGRIERLKEELLVKGGK